MRRRSNRPQAVVAVAGLGVAVALIDGCWGPAAPPPGPPPAPAWLDPPAAQAPGLPGLAAPSVVEAFVPTVADPAKKVFDPGRITHVLDDPRLAKIKALLAAGKVPDATNTLAKLTASAAGDLERARWHYQIGMLWLGTDVPVAAAEAFDKAAAVRWPLADYARLLAADLWVRIGKPAEALSRLQAIGGTLAVPDDLSLVKARALAALHRVDEAEPLWSAYIARRPAGWQTVALELGRALLDQPSVAHAERAVQVARAVIYESTLGRGVGEAREIEKQALASIPSTRRGALAGADRDARVQRARALADALQGREAVAEADKLVKSLGDDAAKPSEASCEAYLARAKGLATLRRYAEASDAGGTAVDRCEGHPRQAVALFLGGRYALRGGQTSAARKRYGLLEQKFPKHSFADDARLHGANAALALGDEAAFTKMLANIDEIYPKGDMVDDALFTLARRRIELGDWAGAVAPLTRAVRLEKRGRPYYAEGRPQYFLARAKLALGSTAEGLGMLARVMRDFPLSYYAVMAHVRLAQHDSTKAAAVLAAARDAEPRGDFVIADHPELHRPAFERAVELVRQGDGPRARAELDTLGVQSREAHPSLLWAAAFLLARIDAPTESHGVLRAAPGAWQEHYPAGIWQPVWRVAYPRPYRALVEKEAKSARISEHLAYAIMREESAFKPAVVSSAGARGLMQLMVPTARMVGKKLGLAVTPAALSVPAVNVKLGCSLLGSLVRRFDYNGVLAIPGYNAGPGAPDKWVNERPAEDFDVWIERIPYRETRHYTKRVITSMAAYATLYGAGLGDMLEIPLKVKP